MGRKKKVKVFVSYARGNRSLPFEFIEEFQQQTGPSRFYKYDYWTDDKIPVGKNFNQTILQALDDCTLGLILVSPAYLNSKYCTEKELPKLLNRDDKAVVPVMLWHVSLGRHDLHGLDELQIFQLDSKNADSPRAYGDCKTRSREKFVRQLFEQVELRLDEFFTE